MDDKSSDINFTPDEFFKQANHKEINDIDELNDETFGNLDGEDPNAWESFHFGVVNQNDDQKNENEPPNKLLSKFDSFTIKDLWDNNNPTVADVNLETSKIWSSSDILPPPKPQQNTTPKAITLEDLEKDLLMSSPTPPAAVGSSSHSPSHTHDHFSHTRTHPLPPSQVPYIGVPVPSRGGMYVRHPPPGPYPPASQYNRYPRPHPQYIGRPIHPYMVRGPPPPIRLPPNLSLMGPPRVIPRPLVRSHHPPVIHPPYGPMMMTNPVGFPLHSLPPPPPFLMSKTYELLCDLKPDGSGFMTNKEKEWIIKVQLLQLHTSTPEIDDYYYQNFVQKKMHKNVGEGTVLVAKQPRMNLPPPVTKNENRKKLPTEFEGSLGKVSFGSVVAPRKTIDVAPPISESGSKEFGVNKKRTVLLTIEEIFNILLELDELENRDESNASEMRVTLRDSIFHLIKLDSKDNTNEGEMFFLTMLQFKKGKESLKKFLPYLSEAQAKIVLQYITKNITQIIRKDSIDKVLPSLLPSINGVILILSIDEIIMNIGNLTTAVSSKMADNQFFVELVTTLIRQGNKINESDSTHDNSTKWMSLLNQLHIAFKMLKTKSSLHSDLTLLLSTTTTT